ncbi:MAG: MFS transporter [Thermoplasmata archaeon]
MKKIYPLFVASTSFFLSYYSRLSWSILSVYMPFRPTVQEEALAFSIFFAGYVAVQIPAGLLSDKYSGGSIIFLSLLGLAVGSVLSAFSKSISQEYVASLFMGIAAGWIYPASINIMNHYYKEERAIYIGYYSISWPLAIIVSGALLPTISIRVGWQWGYYSSALLSILIAFMAIPLRTQGKPRKIDLVVLREKNVIFLSLGGMIFFLTYWSITLYAFKYFLSVGISPLIAGFIFSTMAISGLFSSPLSGYIVNGMGLKKAMVSSIIFYGFLVLVFSLVRNSVALITVALLMGFFRFLITPGNSNLIIEIGKERSASVSGISNMFWQSSGIIGPILSSAIILLFGFRVLWLILSIITFIAAYIYQSISLRE